MSGRQSSSRAWFLVDGYDLIAAKLQTFSFKNRSIFEKTTGLGDEIANESPTGVSEVSVTQGGAFFDTAARGSHEALKTLPSDPNDALRVLCLGLAGHVVGAPFIGLSGVFAASYEAVSPVAALTKCNAEYGMQGVLEYGQVVQPLETKTAAWNTKTLGTVVDYTTDPENLVIPITSNSVAAASVVTTTVPHGLTTGQIALIAGVVGSSPDINGERVVTVLSDTTFSVAVNTAAGAGGTGGTVVAANSLAGGAGYQQVTEFSGFTGFVGKIRDSADDVTYADLVTFTNVTAAPGKERLAVTGTIDRYLSFDGTPTGAGSIRAFSGFSRG